MTLKWIEKTVAVSSLKPYERNPRFITKEQFAALKRSLSEDGYHTRIKATPDLRVVGGHQRIRALKELGWGNIEVLVPDREISDQEFRRILIRDNVNYGEFDMDILSADFDVEELTDWGLTADQLGTFGAGDEEKSGDGAATPGGDVFAVSVEFSDEKAQESFIKEMKLRSISCKKLSSKSNEP